MRLEHFSVEFFIQMHTCKWLGTGDRQGQGILPLQSNRADQYSCRSGSWESNWEKIRADLMFSNISTSCPTGWLLWLAYWTWLYSLQLQSIWLSLRGLQPSGAVSLFTRRGWRKVWSLCSWLSFVPEWWLYT